MSFSEVKKARVSLPRTRLLISDGGNLIIVRLGGSVQVADC